MSPELKGLKEFKELGIISRINCVLLVLLVTIIRPNDHLVYSRCPMGIPSAFPTIVSVCYFIIATIRCVPPRQQGASGCLAVQCPLE